MQAKVTLTHKQEFQLLNMVSLGIVDGKLVRGYQEVVTKDGRKCFIHCEVLEEVEVFKYLHG